MGITVIPAYRVVTTFAKRTRDLPAEEGSGELERNLRQYVRNLLAMLHPSIMELGERSAATQLGDGVKINQTLCFSVNQALLGAQAGSAYVSPFVGRLDDVGEDGISVVRDIASIYRKHDIATEVLAASIRSPLHCIAAADAGAHIATIPFKVLTQMIDHPLTTAGLARFTQDWESATKQ